MHRVSVEEPSSPRSSTGFDSSDGESGSAKAPRSPLGRLVASFANYMGSSNRTTVVDAWSAENRSRPVVTYGDIVPNEMEAEADGLDQESWFTEADASETSATNAANPDLGQTPKNDLPLSLSNRSALTTLVGPRGKRSTATGTADCGAASSTAEAFGVPDSGPRDGCPALSVNLPRDHHAEQHQAVTDLEEFGVMVPGGVPYHGMPHRDPHELRDQRNEGIPAASPQDRYRASSEMYSYSQSAPSVSSSGLLHALSESDSKSESIRSGTQVPVMSPSLVWRKLEQYFSHSSSAKSQSDESNEEATGSYRSGRGYSANGPPSNPVAFGRHRRPNAIHPEVEATQGVHWQSEETAMDTAGASSQWMDLPTSPVTPPIDIASPKRMPTYAQAVGAELAAEIAASHVRRQCNAQMAGVRSTQPGTESATTMTESGKNTRTSHLQRAGKATEQYRDLWLYSTGM
jgi:hypothetical protein